MMKRIVILLLAGLLLCGGLFLLAGDLAVTGLADLLNRLAYVITAERPDQITLIDGSGQAANNSRDGAQAIPAGVAELAAEITAEAFDDYARLEAIYDWVTHNIEYDLEKLKDMQAYGAGAEYVLGKRKGVCHDYADLAKSLLLAVGIEATYESGEVYPSPGVTELHAWNQALVDGTWYALDTTWGAGSILAEAERFVRNPRRLYLATPEELQRLHRDPAYREEKELEYSRSRSAGAPAKYLPDCEQGLVILLNDYRASAGLPPLSEETRLTAAARQDAARMAEATIYNTGYNPGDLESEIKQWARELRIKSYCRELYGYWTYETITAEELYRQMRSAPAADCLAGAAYQTVSLGIVRKGDFTVVVCLYLEHY